MAAEMGVSIKTLWGWENDLWLPSFATAKLVAKGFLL
jgi:DNA-binding XRE family transcriptional regulator